jgi:hypothetical protein
VESQQPDGRFVALVLRDLGAESVTFVEQHAEVETEPNTLTAKIGDGRTVVVRFAALTEERDALARRLEMLVQSFADSFANERDPRPQSTPPTRSLQDELRALQVRAIARDALVIDAYSPVIWASASEISELAHRELDKPRVNVSSPYLVRGAGSSNWSDESGPLSDSDELDPSARAIDKVRHAVQSFNLKQGKPFQNTENGSPMSYLAQGFSGIYILILVFDGAFDELRAHRSVGESMSRIEKLVLALPPHDPDPTDGNNVVAMRKRRR